MQTAHRRPQPWPMAIYPSSHIKITLFRRKLHVLHRFKSDRLGILQRKKNEYHSQKSFRKTWLLIKTPSPDRAPFHIRSAKTMYIHACINYKTTKMVKDTIVNLILLFHLTHKCMLFAFVCWAFIFHISFRRIWIPQTQSSSSLYINTN